MVEKRDGNGRKREALTLEEFSFPAYEEWLHRATKALRDLPNGFSFESEHLKPKPIYRSEDIEGMAHMDRAREMSWRVRIEPGVNRAWDIRQPIAIRDPEWFAIAAQDALQNGQSTLHIQLDQRTRVGEDPDQASPKEGARQGLSLFCLRDLERALATIEWERTPIYIESGPLSFPILCLFAALAKKQGKDLTNWRGCIGADPYATWVSEGRLTMALPHIFDWMADTIRWTETNAPRLQTICAQSTPYHLGGANAIQEVAFTLATAVEYTRELQKRGFTIDQIAPHIHFSFSTQSTFFIEVAKLRAARWLWSNIVKAFGGSSASREMLIHARTSARTKTLLDPHTNILRATTEAFAAIVGGADSLQVSPYSEATDPSDSLARRLARNTQLILKEEAYLSKVIDPAGGSWYVESLTDSIAESAYTLFQQIEKMGGMKKALLRHFPQNEINKIAEKRRRRAETRVDKRIGVNVFPNLSESLALYRDQKFSARRPQAAREAPPPINVGQLKRRIQRDAKDRLRPIIDAFRHGLPLSACYRLAPEGKREPSIQTIQAERVGEPFESLRLAAWRYRERTGKLPQLFVLRFGSEDDQSARTDFVQQFFAVGGFETKISEPFVTLEQAVAACVASNEDTIVLCVPMDTYRICELVERIVKQKPNVTLLLAGQPSVEQQKRFQQAGIDDFIHHQTNCVELLRKLQRKKGIDG